MKQQEFLQRLKSGDTGLLKQYIRKFTGMVQHLAKGAGWQEEGRKDIEDIVQKGLEVLWLKLQSQDHIRGSVEAYMYGIFRNLWNRRWQDRQKAPIPLDASKELSDAEAEKDIEAYLRTKKQYELAQNAFSIMEQEGKGDCVKLIKDTFMSDMSDREIALEMNMSYHAVRVKRNRCMKYLQQYLARLSTPTFS